MHFRDRHEAGRALAGAFDHLEIVLTGELPRRTAIQIEHHIVETTDDQQRRRIDIGEIVLNQVEATALFDRLLAVATRPDLISLYRHLQDAVRLRHLPAFRRCVARLGDPTAGRGPGG